jgi:hypothetical protein
LKADTLATNEELVPEYLSLYAKGRRTFSLLFSRWMDTNEWSHPTMVRLSHACMGGVRWLHSSQISGLRHNGLENPGPRTFIALERLNYYVHRYSTTKRLIPGTASSNDYRLAYAITEYGEPPSAGWFFEVFCGIREPKDIDLHEAYFTESQASELSANWGALIRKLMRDRDLDVITDLDKVLRESYPARDFDRLTRLREVISNQNAWSPDELAMEIPALTTLTAQLGGPAKEQDLLLYLEEKRP